MTRLTYTVGTLDELVTDAGCHLERMGDREWCLIASRSDGSEVVVHLTGRVTGVEERAIPVPQPQS